MQHPNLLDSRQALLLIIDIQEAFRKVLPDVTDLIANVTTLIEAAKVLQLPTIVTEQYPQGLGKTLKEISDSLGEHQCFSKTAFSCTGAEGFLQYLKQSKRKQIIVCGIETHVCVNQTVHNLMQLGYQMHVVQDAVCSRLPKNKEIGLKKMLSSGANIASVEMALFEMLGGSEAEPFKAIQRLVK